MARGAQTRQIGRQFLSLDLRTPWPGTLLGLIGAWVAGRAMRRRGRRAKGTVSFEHDEASFHLGRIRRSALLT